MRERLSVCVRERARARERERERVRDLLRKNQIGMEEIATNSYGGRLRLLI